MSPDLTNSIRAVIFDLDGTLVDTASEIAVACGCWSSARALVEGGDLIEVKPAVERFETHYAQTVGTEARLFPGVMPGLNRLAGAWIDMSVVTNKPRFFDGLRRNPMPACSWPETLDCDRLVGTVDEAARLLTGVA